MKEPGTEAQAIDHPTDGHTSEPPRSYPSQVDIIARTRS
jgi:hypothetical protein